MPFKGYHNQSAEWLFGIHQGHFQSNRCAKLWQKYYNTNIYFATTTANPHLSNVLYPQTQSQTPLIINNGKKIKKATPAYRSGLKYIG
ncbi:MAG TPA: hypothetical protein PLS94_15775 [Prolixibacteraceae bacterium]|nr:hypothetical protein [Prolixibacteraceae bacterium]